MISLNKNNQQHFFWEKRIRLVSLVIFLFGLLIIFRLFYLSVYQHSFYEAIATNRQAVNENLLPERGSIYVREDGKLYPLVTNQQYFLVYAEPNKVESAKEVVDKLTPILNLSEEEWKGLLNRLAKKSDPYEPIMHKVTQNQVDQIKKLDLTGVGFVGETYRYYPEKNIGGHIFGFVTHSDQEVKGQYGLEGYFNKELSGQSGNIKSIKDALGALITIGPRTVESAQDGDNLVLTIDRKVQFTACEKLKFFYDYFEAQDASVIIMDPKTGAILAMCSFPDFDPSNYGQVDSINQFNNPAIFYDFEPGSVFKAFTMSAAIDTGAVSPDTTYDDTGEVKIGPYKIQNSDLKANGQQTMTQVLEKSLNTGAIFAADSIGKNKFVQYVKDFGFGQPTGITLETEVPGNISSLNKPGDIYYLTASFGQGVTVTPLQLVSAFGVIANQGKLLKPYIVSDIIKPDGTDIAAKPEVARQVIKPKTAALVTGMLTSVIKNGVAKKASVPGYYLAGKTGTAQIASSNGGYGKETNHTFIGFGPVTDPRFVILVKLGKPQGINYAADSVAPIFSQLAAFLLNYYQIPPDY
ncbi:MAG: penicillin-binding protein 2 [Candidatus Buchananbacteria bacterium]|nr:penicillin-binding protein 2 [Candidatus Buchananbacteria bacterium]